MSAEAGNEADPLWTPTHQPDGVSGAQKTTKSGVLVLAGTPIGDPADASPRLREALATADIVAAEDTRRLRRLLRDLGVELTGRVVSYYDANESARTPELIDALRAGSRVVVVTDAGMPSVSDPGYRLVAAAHDAGVRVTSVPGPSAVLTALVMSGLPVDRFCFEGFLPRKAGERAARLRALTDEPRTLVFFEAPHRLAVMLAAVAEAFGSERRAAVCREMTKTYEEVRRGGLGDLSTWATDGVRGEITIVVAGAEPRAPADTADLVAAVLIRVGAGEGLKEATAEVAKEHGVVRRDLYQAVLDARAAKPPTPSSDPSRGG
jgi:16S rRNA (cytidine1402-2'-O)-methyltransferase